MKEQIIDIRGSRIYTASGVKTAFGDCDFKVGDWVRTCGNGVFGHSPGKSAPPYVPTEKLGILILSASDEVISIYIYDKLAKLGEFNLSGYTLLGYVNGKKKHYLFVSEANSNAYCIDLLSNDINKLPIESWSIKGAHCNDSELYILAIKATVWDMHTRYVIDGFQVGLNIPYLLKSNVAITNNCEQIIKEYVLTKINDAVAEFGQDCSNKGYTLFRQQIPYYDDLDSYQKGDILSSDGYSVAGRRCYECLVDDAPIIPGNNQYWRYVGIEGNIAHLSCTIECIDPVVSPVFYSQGIYHLDRDLEFFGMYACEAAVTEKFNVIINGNAVNTHSGNSDNYKYLCYVCKDKIVPITDSKYIEINKALQPARQDTGISWVSNMPYHFILNGYVYAYGINLPAYYNNSVQYHVNEDNKNIRHGDTTLIAELTEDTSKYDLDNDNIYNLSVRHTINRQNLSVTKSFDTGGTLSNYRLIKASEPEETAKKIVAAMSK